MLQAVLIALIRVYQMTLSRLLFAAFGPVCRFEPSCSRYALACIEGQGALRGSLLSVKRLCKCHPFHPGGHDPPPPPRPGSRAFLREQSTAQSQRAPLMPSTPGDSAPLAGPDQIRGASARTGPH